MKSLQVLREFEAGLLESLERTRNRIAEIESRRDDAGEQPTDAAEPLAAEDQNFEETPYQARPFYR